MNWSKYRHNRRDMSKHCAQRRSYHGMLATAPARKHRAAVLEDAKGQELANRMTQAAAQVTAMAQSEALRAALANSSLTPEQLTQTVERAARAVRAAIKKQGRHIR